MTEDWLDRRVREALDEDIGPGDLTAEATVPEGARCRARLVAKQAGVLSGMRPFRRAFDLAGAAPESWHASEDGARFAPGDVLAAFEGDTRGTLSGERVALNFLQRLSGTATLTAQFVDAVGELPCRVCDTRKTTPLFRPLEREAVRHGGGANHRYNLASGVLIKENHIRAAGGVAAALHAVQGKAPHLVGIEIEVTTLDELREALGAGATAVLLDNMDLDTMREAVGLARELAPGVLLEASGNVTVARVRAIAETGVDLVSVGALTHSAPAADVSLLIEAL
jgi:nicotinate-nucleotide pyrophosphorylase (carboxylating)